MDRVLVFIKKIIPKKVFLFFQPVYHFSMAFLASVVYRFPSKKLLVVGVTGTTGKTTSVYLMAKMLKNAGFKIGWTSTALLSDGKKEWLNDKKMTMLGRFFTQKMLRQMVKNGCQIAIIETTSEGIRQFRHKFINYDIVVFTGLYPEHIESHGSFENYKKEKLKLFKHLEHSKKKKKIEFSNIKKTIIVNGDDKYFNEFQNFSVPKKIIFSKKDVWQNKSENVIMYKILDSGDFGTTFLFNKTKIYLQILGSFNAINATIAGSVGVALNISENNIKAGLQKIKNIPGRLEKINEGQDFMVIVDYAFEPKALKKTYETISKIRHNKIIHVLGSAGGGRDISRREKLGGLAGKEADYVIVTNEDPYDDDPLEIIKDVADGARKVGKIENENLFLIKDREKGIKKAISLADNKDIVLITGKGSEQAIAVANGKLIPWDDRKVVRNILKN